MLTPWRKCQSQQRVIFNQWKRSISSKYNKLYETHIPISLLERTFLAAGSAVVALYNPLRGDLVAALGETTGTGALRRLRDQMLQSPNGRRILRERPSINTSTIDFDTLRRTCAPGTFGAEYVQWLDVQGVTPDTRDPVHYVDDEELAYVMKRYREIHDFFHTLTGLGVTVEEEVALKWFEWVQTGLPMTMLSSLVGPCRLSRVEQRRLFGTYVPWALQTGATAVPLMSVYFEDTFHVPLENLRKQLGITPAPLPPPSS